MKSVQTVLGFKSIEDLGMTLMHEHLIIDRRHLWKKPKGVKEEFSAAPVTMDMLTKLKHQPYANYDNNFYLDLEMIEKEIDYYTKAGGSTIVDVTPIGIGRDAKGLKTLAERSGANIIMGCGYYLEPTHPEGLQERSIEEITDDIVKDLLEGVDDSQIKAGIIGEIGIGPLMTDEEVKVLKAAARAQKITGKILTIHLPGWERFAHKVLDIVEQEGGRAEQVVLNHMNPSMNDMEYQTTLADRGAFLEYDMIGIDYVFPEGPSPSDEDNAEAIVRLMDLGYKNAILLSQDVFMKSLLRQYGGGGYAHIIENFVPRLQRLGLSESEINDLLIKNPRAVFQRADG